MRGDEGGKVRVAGYKGSATGSPSRANRRPARVCAPPLKGVSATPGPA